MKIGLLRCFLAVLVGMTIISFAEASSCGDMTVMRATVPGKGEIALVLDSKRVQNTPSWDPLTDKEPPISISEASDISAGWARENYKNSDGFEFRQIALAVLGCSLSKNKWYYIIEFSLIKNGVRLFGQGSWLVVLMDGTIVEPSSNFR